MNLTKRIISAILVILILLLSISSCYSLFAEIGMPNILIMPTFENDTYLIISNKLINKKEKTSLKILPKSLNAEYYCEIKTIYNVEFFEDYFNVYLSMSDSSVPYNNGGYCDYTVTWGYDGKEIARELTRRDIDIIKLKSKNEISFYLSNIPPSTSYYPDKPTEIKNIMDFLNERYKTDDSKTRYLSSVTTKTNNTVWFSASVSDEIGFPHANPLINGIDKSEIFTYNSNTKEFNLIYTYNKKNEQIIELDKNGFYTLTTKKKIKYIDLETKKSTNICTLTIGHQNIYLTDKYILIESHNDFFLYQKNGDLIITS